MIHVSIYLAHLWDLASLSSNICSGFQLPLIARISAPGVICGECLAFHWSINPPCSTLNRKARSTNFRISRSFGTKINLWDCDRCYSNPILHPCGTFQKQPLVHKRYILATKHQESMKYDGIWMLTAGNYMQRIQGKFKRLRWMSTSILAHLSSATPAITQPLSTWDQGSLGKPHNSQKGPWLFTQCLPRYRGNTFFDFKMTFQISTSL